jgi:serine/threonine-protein kinase
VPTWSPATVTKSCPRCRRVFDQAGQFCPDDGAPLSASNAPDPVISAALAADYRILDWLGAGGMGQVFLAEQIRVGNRKVALKVLHRRFSEDEEFIGRFQNEAASTGRINHPNVITIYESKQAPDGTLYIAMELVEGESLTEILRKRGRLPLGEVIEIVLQCCKALQAAHRLGIIHRDIKPDNIMLTRDIDAAPLVKILDFGIAKLKDSTGHTVTGSVLGTPAYMSYEQASGLSSEMLDGRSDLYSLGIVTYAMITGHPPFRADTPVGYITKHLSEQPVPLRSLRPEVPAGVEAAVMRVLEKDREKRFQTAAEFGAALRDGSRAGTPDEAAVLETVPTPVPPWRPRASAAQTTQVGLANSRAVADPAASTPSQEAATLPPGILVTPPTAPPAVSSPAVSPPPPARPAAPGFPTPTARTPEPRMATPPTVPPPQGRRVPVTAPAHSPAPVTTRAVTPPRRPAPVPEEAPARRPAGGGEGLAAALWGVRTLLSWGITVYAILFLTLFAGPLAAPLLGGAVMFPVVAIAEPVVSQVGQWVPTIRFGDWDPLPLVLAVALLLIRPRITTPLWRLEARCRARATMEEPAG